jgi:hypothetical protein
MKNKKMVICGSMKFLNKMKEWQPKLESQGYNIGIPTLKEFKSIKRKETKNHFKK